MGTMYKQEVSFGTDVSAKDVADIIQVLKDELPEFTDYPFYGRWSQKNGFDKDIFVKISQEYENVLMIVQSVRIEDFQFNNTSISVYWFYNGKYLHSSCNIIPEIKDSEIDTFLSENIKQHQHVFTTVVKVNSDSVVMGCRCGQEVIYKRDS